MGTVVHRETKEVRFSQNCPDYDNAQWILDADVSNVIEQDPKFWVIEGDCIRLATEEEQAAIIALEQSVQIIGDQWHQGNL